MATLKEALASLFTETKTEKAKKPISTQAQAEAAAPGLHRVKDAVGLYLNKGDGDAGSWFHRYWFGGKRREIGLGALAGTSLVEARKKLAEIVALRNAGKDPIVARRAAKLAAADAARAEEIAANKWTFKVAVEDYLAAHVGSWKRADAKRVWHGPFVRYAYPVLRSMPLDDIRVEHIVAVMNACTEASVKATGIKLRGHIEQVLNAAIAKGQRNASLGNPASVRLVPSELAACVTRALGLPEIVALNHARCRVPGLCLHPDRRLRGSYRWRDRRCNRRRGGSPQVVGRLED